MFVTDILARCQALQSRFALLAAAMLVLAACDQADRVPTAPQARAAPQVAPDLVVTGSKFRRPDEDKLVALAKEIPGFAGYYVDDQRNIIAYVTDTTRSAQAARTALLRHLSTDNLGLPAKLRTGRIVIRKGEYSFQELSDWRDLATEQVLGTITGVVYDDLDEARNRVTIGVLKTNAEGIESAVTVRLTALGVPGKALNFELTDPVVPLAALPGGSLFHSNGGFFTSATYLNSGTDTLAAGFEVDNISLSVACSIGMVLDRNSTRYVSVASHCTSTPFGADPTDQWYQGSSFIGNEAWDTTASPRHSDLALIGVPSTVPSIRGAIARSTPRDSGMSASRAIDTSSPFVYLFAASTTPVTGLEVDKEGRTTGRTHGTITNTCTDQTVDGHTVLCEIKTSVWSGQGDSGSSLWAWDGVDGATLYGVAGSLVVTGHQDYIDGQWVTTGGTSWFASYGGFISDIGSSGIAVTTGTTVGSFSISGSVSSGSPVVSWSPPTVTNTTSSDTYYYVYRATQVLGGSSEPEELIDGHYGGTTYLDLNETVTSYNGTANPGPHYSWVSYRVVAYNRGVTSGSQTIYFKM